METYIEEFVENTLREDNESKSNFELLKKYFDGITKRDDFNIFDEQYISDIIQLMYSHRFSDSRIKELQDILERNCHISQIDVEAELNALSSFIDDNQSQVITDESKMDEFIKHLGRVKLAKSRILQQSLIDFVIKQTLFADSAISKNPEKYQGLVERCIEDLGRNDLQGKISQDKYIYLIRDSFAGKSTSGKCISNRVIFIKKDIVTEFVREKTILVLGTIFHENSHARQNNDIYSSNYNGYYKYLMAKEEILRDVYPDFYRMNYENMFIEAEARMLSYFKIMQLLNRMASKDNGKTYFREIEKWNISTYRVALKIEHENLKDSRYKTVSPQSEKPARVEDIFDEIILKNPKYLKMYPKLMMEYNPDGTVKRIGDILPSIDSDETLRDRALYLKILMNGNCFKLENFPEDLNSLMSYEIQNKSSVYTIALIMVQNIPRLLSEFDKIPREKLAVLYNEICSIQKRMEEVQSKQSEELTYSEKAFLIGMTKVNKEYSKNALSMFFETKEKIESLEIDVASIGTEELKANQDTEAGRPNGVGVLADAFYQTSEEDRRKLMAELIDLGLSNQSHNETKEDEQEIDDVTRT